MRMWSTLGSPLYAIDQCDGQRRKVLDMQHIPICPTLSSGVPVHLPHMLLQAHILLRLPCRAPLQHPSAVAYTAAAHLPSVHLQQDTLASWTPTSSLVKRPRSRRRTTSMAQRRRTPTEADTAAGRPAHAREMGARWARTLLLAAVLFLGGMAAPAAAAPTRPLDALSHREHVALPPPDPHEVALQEDSRPEVRLFTFGFLAGGQMDLYLADYHVRAPPAAQGHRSQNLMR